MSDWTKKEIGVDNILEDAIIMEMLGSHKARVKAICRVIRRHAKRYLGIR